MIVSHRHKFVFVRPTKTGSSSAQAMIVESGALGEGDGFSTYRDRIQDQAVKGKGLLPVSAAVLRRVSPYPIPKDLFVVDEEIPLIGHMTPTEMLRTGVIDERIVDTYTFVTIIRDPIERFLSAYFFGCYLRKRACNSEADVFDALDRELDLVLNPFLGRRQVDYTVCEGLPLLSLRMLRHPNLTSDLQKLLDGYGQYPLRELRLKSGYRPDWSRRPYQQWLPARYVAMLTERFAADMEMWRVHSR